MRDNCEILIQVNIKEAINNGYDFYISDNRVILSEGKNGIIPTKYFNIINILKYFFKFRMQQCHICINEIYIFFIYLKNNKTKINFIIF